VKKRTRKLRVEVRRDGNDGHLYSDLVDLNRPDAYSRKDGETYAMVVDRQKGRMLDAETVKSRATMLANLLGVEYFEDLEWPCIASQGRNQCRCPECVKQPKAGR
jgi:hypothetical protein